ncbi:MAG: hypothetical protein RL514_3490 [Verrucomicrobiota bacterium]|jgi:Tfp pilus assembly protein PilN
MTPAAAEWETIREAFRTGDAFTLLGLVSADGRRRRFARLLPKHDFLAGAAAAEMHLDGQLSLDEVARILDYLKSPHE